MGLWLAGGARGGRNWGMAHCGARISRRGARRQQWRLRLALACLLLKSNGEGLAQLNEGRGARVCSRWLGGNAQRREAQRGGGCKRVCGVSRRASTRQDGRRRVPRWQGLTARGNMMLGGVQ